MTEEAWYKPYHGKELEILRWDLGGDPWFEGDVQYHAGIRVETEHLRLIVESNKFSEENRPKIGQEVRLVSSSENEAEQFLGQTFTVVADDEDGLPILLDCPAFEHGLYVELSDIESVAEKDLLQQNLHLQDPYDLPCDFKVGDEVTCLMHGDGVVEEVKSGATFPVRVLINENEILTFTTDGKYSADSARTLFHKGTVKLVAVEQQYKPEYEAGQLLYAMADGKITALTVKQDHKDRVVDMDGFVFKKSDFTFHLPA